MYIYIYIYYIWETCQVGKIKSVQDGKKLVYKLEWYHLQRNISLFGDMRIIDMMKILMVIEKWCKPMIEFSCLILHLLLLDKWETCQVGALFWFPHSKTQCIYIYIVYAHGAFVFRLETCLFMFAALNQMEKQNLIRSTKTLKEIANPWCFFWSYGAIYPDMNSYNYIQYY